jgi:hypothetical protein
MPEAAARRAVRGAARREMQPGECALVERLLADLPRRSDDAGDRVRLAAAGSELVYQRGYLERLRGLIRDGELRLGTFDEERLVETAAAATGELVRRIEEHLGSFPAAEEPWAGVRETFLVDIAPDRREDARTVVEIAHQASDAPEPVELVGRMALRAAGEDLGEVARFLSELAAGSGEEELRDLIAEVEAGCGELALLIAGTLPPEPTQASVRHRLTSRQRRSEMPKTNLERGPWPWRWEPGNGFHNVAVHGRISAGFEIETHMVDDREYDRSSSPGTSRS